MATKVTNIIFTQHYTDQPEENSTGICLCLTKMWSEFFLMIHCQTICEINASFGI
jgi:hypothetical protein